MAEEIQNTTSGGTTSKLYAALSYCGILWLIPYFLAKGADRTPDLIVHLKQGLGVLIVFLAAQIFSSIGVTIFYILSLITWLAGVGLFIIGIIHAWKGKAVPLPIIGSALEGLPIK